MKKGFLLIITLIFLMGCASSKRVYKPQCLELDKQLAELKNEKKFNSASLLTKMTLSNSVGMVNENSLDKEIQLSEMKLEKCNR
ncbi:MAG: Unknown protein [uncultured Sulfurovum sp.]|uniref:Lipoprotein n=1 Tax=uncultured Sulfurovum sp. TaxID=269237 RepID=A0A6S6S2C6_9BACT|nr:MAG: Unknown protein [uncultured Sulfurovum sp.]